MGRYHMTDGITENYFLTVLTTIFQLIGIHPPGTFLHRSIRMLLKIMLMTIIAIFSGRNNRSPSTQQPYSYLIGFGKNYPVKPHHRGSSCPDMPSSCGWNEYNSASANPQVRLKYNIAWQARTRRQKPQMCINVATILTIIFP